MAQIELEIPDSDYCFLDCISKICNKNMNQLILSTIHDEIKRICEEITEII